MAQAVSAAASAFPGIDRDVAVTGALLHDIGKTQAYNDDLLAIDLTDAGRLQGEIPLGYYLVRSTIESIEGFDPAEAQAVLHIILSHHGSYENGSPVVPATREATLVHSMDNLGGKLGSFDRIERELPAGEAWSRFDRGIDSAAYFGTPAVASPCGPARAREAEPAAVARMPRPFPVRPSQEEGPSTRCIGAHEMTTDVRRPRSSTSTPAAPSLSLASATCRSRPDEAAAGGRRGAAAGLPQHRHRRRLRQRARGSARRSPAPGSPREDAVRDHQAVELRPRQRCDARRAFEGSLGRLGLDHVDLYLIHWPVPSHDLYVETWQAMEKLRGEGRVPVDRRLQLQRRAPRPAGRRDRTWSRR